MSPELSTGESSPLLAEILEGAASLLGVRDDQGTTLELVFDCGRLRKIYRHVVHGRNVLSEYDAEAERLLEHLTRVGDAG